MEVKAAITQLALKTPVTALSFCNENLLAVGCQDGAIIFVSFADGKLEVVEEV